MRSRASLKLFHPTSVLIIDDDPLQLEILNHHFSAKGVPDILLAVDGKKASKLIEGLKQPVDLIISDIYMPELDGIEFLKVLHKHAGNAAVILISGGNQGQLRAAKELATCYKINCIAAMCKPLDLVALDRKLGEFSVA